MSRRNARVTAGSCELGTHVDVAFLRDGRERECASVLLGDLACQSMLQYREGEGSDAYPTPFIDKQRKRVLSVSREKVVGKRRCTLLQDGLAL